MTGNPLRDAIAEALAEKCGCKQYGDYDLETHMDDADAVIVTLTEHKAEVLALLGTEQVAAPQPPIIHLLNPHRKVQASACSMLWRAGPERFTTDPSLVTCRSCRRSPLLAAAASPTESEGPS